MSKKRESPYASPILKCWEEFCQNQHTKIELDAEGYMMISAAIGYVADELAEIKAILSQKGVK